ncbi:hypothetical protein DW1_2592 [Proteiniborus sp. DW1]|uniref:hypothetical protein n=1 Tax=Proteiniborus sp. DW1 TaxID=1889883 RepID=UPI00092DED31|nr:hypothetical protein [Proteiniborus sp. DW1]SCG84153.1 hypothetical protein DW1_2592 [Proteiniborus sp. DW1]
MKNFMSLKVLDKFRFLFERVGVNYEVMRSILQIKLSIDERRVPVAIGASNNGKNENNLFKNYLFSYGIMGLFFMFFIIIPIPIYASMSISFGILIFMMLTTMIADFSSVLLDIKSKNILFSRPIDEKTYNMSKIVHIFIYMFTLTIAMAGPSLIAGSIKYGVVFFLVYTIELIFIAGLVVFLASLLYSLILKYFDGEKLKDIINYFQIALSIVMIVGYQLVGRMFNFIDIRVTANPKWWNFLLPPAWFAAPFEVFINGNYGSWYLYLSLFALLIPILFLFIHTKIVMPNFENNLLKLNSSGEKGRTLAERKKKLNKIVADLLCYNKTERTFFRFSQNLLANERKLKLKIYPTLAFAAIFPFLTLLNYVRSGVTLTEMFTSLTEGKAYLGIYLSILMLSSTVMLIELSENYKSAWIYKTLPIESPEHIYKGAIKAYIYKYCLGILTFVSFIFLILYKFSIILDVVLMFINMMFIVAIVFKNGSKRPPFSQDADKVQKQSTGSFLLTLLIIGLTAGLHWITRLNSFIFYGYIAIALIVTLIMWKKVFKVNWEAFN